MNTALERIAAYVRNVRQQGRAARPRRPPRARSTRLLEVEYAKRLVAIVADLRQAVEQTVLPELPALLASARASRGDAAETVRDVAGLRVVVEYPAGTERNGYTLLYDYGRLDGFIGADGEDVDVYLGPIAEPDRVHVVHQRSKAHDFDRYDEDKVMLGWPDAAAAERAYLEQYADPRFFGGMSTFTVDDFKARLVRCEGRKITHADARELRLDVGEGRKARALMDRAGERATGAARAAERASMEIAGRVSKQQQEDLARRSTAAIGADITPLLGNTKVPAILEGFVHENVSLIKSLSLKSLGEVEKLVTRAITEGKHHETLAKEIQERFGIAERHARLIARDQIGKLNGQLSAARNRELGINRFRWRHSKLPNGRPHHKARDGKVFRYDTPPEDGLPGTAILCRCGDEPLFEDLLEALDAAPRGATPQPAAPATAARPEKPRTPAGFSAPDDAKVRQGVPTREEAKRAGVGTVHVFRPSDLAHRPLTGIDTGGDKPGDPRTQAIHDAWKRGEKVPPIEIHIGPRGEYFIADGNHRVIAAAQDGDRPIAAIVKVVDDTGLARMDPMSSRIRAATAGGAAGGPSAATAPPALPPSPPGGGGPGGDGSGGGGGGGGGDDDSGRGSTGSTRTLTTRPLATDTAPPDSGATPSRIGTVPSPAPPPPRNADRVQTVAPKGPGDTRIADIEKVRSKTSQGAYRVTLATDGQHYLWKPSSEEAGIWPGTGASRTNIRPGTSYLREAAMSDVSSILGVSDLVPRAVTRTVGGVPGSMREWFFDDSKVHRLERAPSERMRVADFVAGNSDRHSSNIRATGPRSAQVPMMVDNGLAFPNGPPDKFKQPVAAIMPFQGMGLLDETKAQIASINSRLDELAATLHSGGIEPEAIRHTLYRARALAKDPSLIEVPVQASVGKAAHESAELHLTLNARNAAKLLSDEDRAEIEGIVRKVTGAK